jgi:3-phenylpropionate/trans-cinnamate dioxygenase ferredoxin reductase subunit
MSNIKDVVIVGAGQSGGWAAKTLRDVGFAGSVLLVGDERHFPYERPPLSKNVLVGEFGPGACQLWQPDRLTERGIRTELGLRAESVDRVKGQLVCQDGRSFRYDRLLIATGARPRQLVCEGADLKGVHYLRTIDDCLGIRSSLGTGGRLVVIGGGWIGLEVAASARGRGMHVTVLEASDQLCGRSLPNSLGKFFLEQHLQRGVDVRLGARLKRIVGDDQVKGVELQDGTVLEASIVVVGIGVVPNDELARSCGLEVGNGIIVDANCRTSDPQIYACGDVADQPFGQGRIRFESWKNAQDQGVAAAKAMLGTEAVAKEIPWFWSDQFDINFQLLGIVPPDALQYRKASASTNGFIDYFMRDGQLVAAAAVNSPRELRDAKRTIQKGMPFSSEGLTLLQDGAA